MVGRIKLVRGNADKGNGWMRRVKKTHQFHWHERGHETLDGSSLLVTAARQLDNTLFFFA